MDNQEEGQELEETEVEESKQAASYPLATKLSTLLFVASRPLSEEALAKATKRSLGDVQVALEQVQEMFSYELHGFSLFAVAGGWQFRSNPELASIVKNLYPQKGRRLSRPAAETLAVVAYKQPIQRAEIEAIRGVDSMQTVKTLIDQKLIRIVGREDTVGQPALYGTTDSFLEKFGLADLSELPPIHELEELAKEPGEPEVSGSA